MAFLSMSRLVAEPERAQEDAQSPPVASQPRDDVSPDRRVLTDEERQRMRVSAKHAAAAFGEVVSVMMRVAPYKDLPLSDLQSLVFPAVASGQYSIAEAQSADTGMSAPVGLVLWASVSAAVDQELSAARDFPLRLKKEDWTSGDIIWLISAIGDMPVVDAILTRLSETQWSGKPVKAVRPNK